MLGIIIPYYKPDFFNFTLKSLANQTDKRFILYIGDDASDSSPEQLLLLYKGQFEYVYQKFNDNLGSVSLVSQWNRCISLSRNEQWLMLLGDDDVLEANVVEEFYDHIQWIEDDVNVVRYATQKINEKGNFISSMYTHPRFENAIDFFFNGTRSSLSEYVFRKSKIDKIGFKDFPLAWFSDVLAVLEFSDFNNIYSINNASVYIRISDLSISGKENNLRNKNRATFEFYFYLIKNKLKYFNKKQREILFFRLNKTYLNDKKRFTVCFKIFQYYFANLMLINVVYFLYSLLLNILKIKNANRIQSK